MSSSNPFEKRNKTGKVRDNKRTSRIVWLCFAIVACLGLLYWNEYANIRKQAKISEIVEFQVGKEIDPSMEGRIVFVTHQLTPSKSYYDSLFHIRLNVPKVSRTSEYYQLLEYKSEVVEKDSEGQETKRAVYKYDNGWTDHPQRQAFHDRKNTNTVRLWVQDSTYTDDMAHVGPYILSDHFLNELILVPIPLKIRNNTSFRQPTIIERHYEDNQIYIGRHPERPAVGDVRVTYMGVPADTVSFIARLDNGRFVAAGFTSGTSDIRRGAVPFETMVGKVSSKQGEFVWIIRGLLGLLLLVCIFYLFKKQNLQNLLLSILFTAILGATVAAVPWLNYKSTIGILLLLPIVLCALVFLAFLLFGRKGKKDPKLVVDPNSASAYGLGPEFKGWLN